MSGSNRNTLPWEKLARFHLIEVIALWEGRLTTNHLQTAFGIGRTTASSLIAAYKRELPDNLILCTKSKGYLPSASFQCRYSRGNVQEYLSLLHARESLNPDFFGLQLRNASTEVLGLPARQVKPEVVRMLVQAANEKKRIEVNYRSFSNPEGEDRIIAPHTLVSAEGRWHVRAWCERDRSFKDFVLHRFTTTPDLLGDRLSDADPLFDNAWNRTVVMEVSPNPRLSPAQQQLVADDYEMGSTHQLNIEIRAPLVKYMAISLRLEITHTSDADPAAHPLILLNPDTLADHLF